MSRLHFAIWSVIVILFSIMIALWFNQLQSIKELRQEISSLKESTPSTPLQTQASDSITPTPAASTDLTTLQTNLDLLTTRVDNLENLPTPTPAASTSIPAPFQKQVITLGSWSTTRQQWTPTGLEISINSTDYPSDVSMFFEAGLQIVNGSAEARITNKSTGAIIDTSEISHNTNEVTWVASPGFQIHSGNNAYVVELRSTSGETAYLTNSRLVINQP